jgi:hypothetical protein
LSFVEGPDDSIVTTLIGESIGNVLGNSPQKYGESARAVQGLHSQIWSMSGNDPAVTVGKMLGGLNPVWDVPRTDKRPATCGKELGLH